MKTTAVEELEILEQHRQAVLKRICEKGPSAQLFTILDEIEYHLPRCRRKARLEQEKGSKQGYV